MSEALIELMKLLAEDPFGGTFSFSPFVTFLAIGWFPVAVKMPA